jgi:hypothetical protein
MYVCIAGSETCPLNPLRKVALSMENSKVLNFEKRCYLPKNTYIYIYRAFSKIHLAMPTCCSGLYCIQSIFKKVMQLNMPITCYSVIY